MTGYDELADSIYRARSITQGNGLNTTMPIRTREDAERVARAYLGHRGRREIEQLADALWRRVQRGKEPPRGSRGRELIIALAAVFAGFGATTLLG